MSSMWSLELAFLFLSLFCWVISIWTPEGWLQEILRSIWQVPEAWGAWRFHQPHQDCRAPSLPHLQVWRWADQPEGVRGPHEGRTEGHLLHHWRKHCCSVFLSILGDPPQEGNRSAVHGCLSYLVTASFIEFSKLTHYDSLTIMDPCCWFPSNHVVGFPTIQDASPFRCLHYPSLSKNAQLPFTYGQLLVDEVHDWMVGTCWHCLLATVKWVKCKVLLRARGWPNWWVCNSAAEGVRWQEAEEHHQGGSRHRWRGWEEEDRGTESGIWAIDQTHEGGTWIGLLVWAFLNDILSGRVPKILSLYVTALKHIKTIYGSGRFCSRMRSKGSRFTLGVWGLRVCSLDVAFVVATVRNRSCEDRMAVPMGSSAEVVIFGGFRCVVASFRVAGVALRDIQTCSATCRKSFCVAGAILLWRFQKMCCSFRGRRSTLDASIVIFRGRRSALNVSCCVCFVNRIGRAASSGDKVQIPWQAWHFLTCAENWRKPRTKHRFWGCKFSGSKANW